MISHRRQIKPPPAVNSDPKAFEILRLWAAHGEQHVCIRSELSGDAGDFGYMLAELAMHGANLYSERDRVSRAKALRMILSRFRQELNSPVGDPSGSIADRGRKLPNQTVQRTGASRSARKTKRKSPAAGSRR